MSHPPPVHPAAAGRAATRNFRPTTRWRAVAVATSRTAAHPSRATVRAPVQPARRAEHPNRVGRTNRRSPASRVRAWSAGSGTERSPGRRIPAAAAEEHPGRGRRAGREARVINVPAPVRTDRLPSLHQAPHGQPHRRSRTQVEPAVRPMSTRPWIAANRADVRMVVQAIPRPTAVFDPVAIPLSGSRSDHDPSRYDRDRPGGPDTRLEFDDASSNRMNGPRCVGQWELRRSRVIAVPRGMSEACRANQLHRAVAPARGAEPASDPPGVTDERGGDAGRAGRRH
jgi:hypothetical protein